MTQTKQNQKRKFLMLMGLLKGKNIMVRLLKLELFSAVNFKNNNTAEDFAARSAQATLVTKTDFDTKLIILNKKNYSNKTKHLLAENELKKLETYDSSYFRGRRYLEEDGNQTQLVFQPMQIYLKTIAGVGSGNCIYFWKSKRCFHGRINSSITPELNYYCTKTRVEFEGSRLKQGKIAVNHGKN